MAIDANVLINERVREELRGGSTPQAAITAGYERAWATILDSNVTTLIAGVALLIFGSGPVRGFAVVHCLGILTSIFSSVVVSRGLINLIYGRRKKLDRAVDRPGLETGHRHQLHRTEGVARHGILPHPQRHPLHAPRAGVQRHFVGHLHRWPCSSSSPRDCTCRSNSPAARCWRSAMRRRPISRRSASSWRAMVSPTPRCRTSAPRATC